MRPVACLLAFLFLGGTPCHTPVLPCPDSGCPEPQDFVTLAQRADSVVRVKESSRSTFQYAPIVTLDVVEQMAGGHVDRLEIAASLWDAIVPWSLRREKTTFLLMVTSTGEIMDVQSNGIPVGSPLVIPILHDMVLEDYVYLYDHDALVRSITLDMVRAQLSRRAQAK
jgi:hypothetical protein